MKQEKLGWKPEELPPDREATDKEVLAAREVEEQQKRLLNDPDFLEVMNEMGYSIKESGDGTSDIEVRDKQGEVVFMENSKAMEEINAAIAALEKKRRIEKASDKDNLQSMN